MKGRKFFCFFFFAIEVQMVLFFVSGLKVSTFLYLIKLTGVKESHYHLMKGVKLKKEDVII